MKNLVRPRRLTLGVYVHALAEAGVDEGEAWPADSVDVALGVLDALCEDVVLEPRDILPVATEQWDRMERARLRALVMAVTIKDAVEQALGESLPPSPIPARFKLLRTLSTLPPTERAAILNEPLTLALIFGFVGPVQRQFDEITKEALKTATG